MFLDNQLNSRINERTKQKEKGVFERDFRGDLYDGRDSCSISACGL